MTLTLASAQPPGHARSSVRSTPARTVQALVVLVVAVLLAACHQAFQTAPHGTVATGPGTATVTGIRFGSAPGYDRIVFDVSGPVPAAQIRYVSQVVADGSGQPVALEGHAFLGLTLAGTHVAAGVPSTFTPRLAEVRQVKKTGDFEAVSSFGIGVTALKGFRIFSLTGPNRLVVDIQH